MFMRNRKHIHFTASLPISFLEKFLKLASQPHPSPRVLSFLFFLVVSIPPLCSAGLYPWSLSTTFSQQSPPSIRLGVLYKSLWQNPNIGLIRLFIFCRSAPRLYKQLCGLILVTCCFVFFSISHGCSVLLDNLSIHPIVFLHHSSQQIFQFLLHHLSSKPITVPCTLSR